MQVADTHVVLGTPMKPPFDGMDTAMFALGCFWGAERIFWRAPGVHSTAVGYAGGKTMNPTYREVCSGQTGHAEVVRVVFDAKKTDYQALVRLFWESHDPTQGNRQGHDVGTQYRSGIYCYTDEQRQLAEASCAGYQAVLSAGGLGTITTEIASAPEFYYAEDYHQQYLEKNPDGYCGLGGTGLKCKI